MSKWFFTWQTELPEDLGFSLFGGRHFAWICGIAFGIFLAVLFFRRLEGRGRERVLNAVIAIALILTGIHELTLAVIGQLSVQLLPLHLCGLAVFVDLICQIRKSDFLREVSVCLLMPGAVAAILFPEWTAYPMFHFMTLYGFSYHALIVLYAALLLAGGYIRPRMSHIWKPLVFLACLVPPIYLFDWVFDCNYLFLFYGPEGSPLAFFDARLNHPGYLAAYAGLVCFLLFLIYGVFELIHCLLSRSPGRMSQGEK